MRPSLSLLAALLLSTLVTRADAQPAVRRGTHLIVMSPSPTQPAAPGLRLRTMVRPADHLWIGPDVPAFVPLEVGTSELDLLDPRPGGGFVATYRERFEQCGAGKGNCATIVKVFDVDGKESASVSLGQFLSRRDQLEVQDVRLADGVLYFNEACQTYSREAGGRCSALVALDLAQKKVLWRTHALVSNNEFRVVGPYLVAAYGFTGEPARVTVLRRQDGAVMDVHRLPGTNFEMTPVGDVLSVRIYQNIGTARFRMVGFDGAAPKLVALATTPPDPNERPKPYDPPLQSARGASPGAARPDVF